jgi:acetyl/propionyl-CoA carboxylase alpha subunit
MCFVLLITIQQQALNAFNDDRMLVEKYIEDGHHIEIQIIADSHGNVVAFPERECSVQRRNQKVYYIHILVISILLPNVVGLQ